MSHDTQIVVNQTTTLRTMSIHDASELFSLVDRNRNYLRQFLGWVDSNRAEGDSEIFIRNVIDSNLRGGTLILGL